MPGSQPRFAIDANVIFDLHAGGLLGIALRAIDCIVPDLVLREECGDPTASQVLAAGAREGSFDPADVRDLVALRRRYPELTLADTSVLALARRERCQVLTRDQPLRRRAEEDGLQVRGTLWLLNHLVGQGVLDPARAADAVDRMLEADRALNRGRASAAIRTWRAADP